MKQTQENFQTSLTLATRLQDGRHEQNLERFEKINRLIWIALGIGLGVSLLSKPGLLELAHLMGFLL